MGRNPADILRALAAPRSVNPEDALREQMIRVVCLTGGAISLVLTFVFLGGLIAGIIPPDSLIITFAMALVFFGGIYLAGTRFWRAAGFVPPLMVFGSAVFGSVIGGPQAPAMVLYALAVAMTAILLGAGAAWGMAALCTASYAGTGAAQMLGLLSVTRTGDTIFINRVIIVAGVYCALAALILFLVSRYRNALAESRGAASKLRMHAVELAEINRQLERENEERRRAQEALAASEERLRESLVEKEVLLREIHHRVKNNFQIIISLLNLQGNTISDETLLREFRESTNRIRAMSLVHEILYQSPNISDINFAAYLRTIATELGQSQAAAGRGPELTCDLEEIRLGIDQAIPCGLILNELITNAFKYAFPDGAAGGRICISLRRAGEDAFVLTVADNGAGIPAGIQIENPPTLGLQLVNVLMKQIGGTCRLDRTGGTSWAITVPIEQSQTAH